MGQYVSAKTFNRFVDNQEKLIEVLNHSMTKISTDVAWIKKTLWWIMGIFSALVVIGMTS
jgi:CRISPR/Cas system CSM-associated protein Csm2 small subunit